MILGLFAVLRLEVLDAAGAGGGTGGAGGVGGIGGGGSGSAVAVPNHENDDLNVRLIQSRTRRLTGTGGAKEVGGVSGGGSGSPMTCEANGPRKSCASSPSSSTRSVRATQSWPWIV